MTCTEERCSGIVELFQEAFSLHETGFGLFGFVDSLLVVANFVPARGDDDDVAELVVPAKLFE
jgi:hypothetical protein